MKLDDLIAALERMRKLQGNPNVMIVDSAGPRDITSGPYLRTITERDAENIGDCEDRVGERCVMLGVG